MVVLEVLFIKFFYSLTTLNRMHMKICQVFKDIGFSFYDRYGFLVSIKISTYVELLCQEMY